MLHTGSYSSTAVEPSSSVDHRINNSGYWDHDYHQHSPRTSPTPTLNDAPAGLQSSQRARKAVEYPGSEHLLRARGLRRQQTREHESENQQQLPHHLHTREEHDLAKALEDSFITETAHRLFLKNKQREEERVRKAQEEVLREQHRREVEKERERYHLEQFYLREKEKMERKQRRKERKAQQQQQQQQQHVSFATPTSSPTTPAPAPLVSSPSSTYSTSTSTSNSTEEISNPENKQLQRLERRFQLRRPSPDINDNPNTGREVYQNPFMQPASRPYFYSPTPSSPTATTSPTISLSTLPPWSPVSSTSYMRNDSHREKEIKQQEKEIERSKQKVNDWIGGGERARYRSSSRFRKETRRSRSRRRDDGYETVWEREERETRVGVDDWVYHDREEFRGTRRVGGGRKSVPWGNWGVGDEF
ncbi:hypothetical protein B0T21DRAFT_426657 [Apiosordaria backusii]|uniref:Uncharacterized protein n=1 Tax=Apiosordaria backusii TaxID=314023 RepID=A0AA40DUZ1_9PEZI|nr:hypothetical protein B0T21DRAFT_426657 [Apiosordaria backusii]